MMKITFNGKPFNASSVEDLVIQAVADQFREKLGTVRHPVTGEFPTVAITGNIASGLQAQVEGSPELLSIIAERLATEEQEPTDSTTSNPNEPSATTPNVFLSYTSEDRPLAQRIAEALQSNGIETWWDNWCISAGDSIRQRIDEGLRDCTHFVVLLTPRSISKPWVNQEMDAGLVKRLGVGTKFIPLRSDLPANQLPPLLQGMHSPQVDQDSFDIAQLINDIHGISRKPALGSAPATKSSSRSNEIGLSPVAEALVKLFVERTDFARKFEPQVLLADAATILGVTADDIRDAAFELNGLVGTFGNSTLYPEAELFVRYDHRWKPWSPAEDAHKIAAAIMSDEALACEPAAISSRFGWEPRRLNPALAFLDNRGLISASRALNNGPWYLAAFHRTDATRRFAKSR